MSETEFDASAVRLSKADAQRINAVKAENVAGKPFYSLAKPMAKLVSTGLIASDASIEHPDNAGKPDDQKLLAFGVTAKGDAVLDAGKVNEVLSAPAVQRAPVPEDGFEIEENFELPAAAPSGRSSMYPFDTLALNAAFFVPNTPARPDAYKSLSSTVSSRNKAAVKKDGASARKFDIARGKNKTGAEGCWVKRSA